MTRAEVVLADIDLLQLSAAVRVLEIEAKAEVPEVSAQEDGSAD
jgi:exoribonuclease-2